MVDAASFALSACEWNFNMFCIVTGLRNDIFICASRKGFVIFLTYFPLYVNIARFYFFVVVNQCVHILHLRDRMFIELVVGILVISQYVSFQLGLFCFFHCWIIVCSILRFKHVVEKCS